MSPLAVRIGAGVLALLALIALRGKRWAYLTFVLLGLLYFPAQTHFRVHAPKCEQLLPTLHLLSPCCTTTRTSRCSPASTGCRGYSSEGQTGAASGRSSRRCSWQPSSRSPRA